MTSLETYEIVSILLGTMIVSVLVGDVCYYVNNRFDVKAKVCNNMPIPTKPSNLVTGRRNKFVNSEINSENEMGKIVGDNSTVKYVDFGIEIYLYNDLRYRTFDEDKEIKRMVVFE